MALTLSTLLTEFYARGFDYLNDGGAGVTRATRWINDAMHAIDEIDRWPYLEATASGAAPLSVTDLGEIETVVDTTTNTVLEYMSREAVVDYYTDPSATGTPSVYYVTGGNTVAVYPTRTSGSITVRYFKTGPDLSSGSDAPLMPDRFRMAIVEYAVAAALRDKSNYQEAAAASQAGDLIVARMRDRFALQAGPDRQILTGASDDW